MRQEVFELVEAARGLQIRLDSRVPGAAGVRVCGDKTDFPVRLRRLAEAIEAVDAAGAGSLEDEPVDPTMDAVRLRMALDGVFRWMRAIGVDVTEPHALVADALTRRIEAPKVPGKAYRNVPRFAHDAASGKGGRSPLLKLGPKPGETVSMRSLQVKAVQAGMTESSLGAASPFR